MLVSNRFTKTITAQTRQRLGSILDNTKPMTRREKNHGAVVAVQTALSDLNQGYLAEAEVDGFYGTRTSEAVEAFQRDYGLFADGIVGRQTLVELDQIFSGDLFREPRGLSIHVGVNFVDEAHYGGRFELSACVNDAHALRDIAVEMGYSPIVLTDEEATTASFTAALRQAVTNLFSGDALLVSFSGHGSQISNTSIDEEADMMDETLCFYDRMLIDDEIYALLSELRPGVQVTMVYDSCHSATVSKRLAVQDPDAVRTVHRSAMLRSMKPADPDAVGAEPGQVNRFTPLDREKIGEALDGDQVPQKDPGQNEEGKVDEIASFLADLEEDRERGAPKFIAFFSGIYDRNKELYTAVKSVVGSREDRELLCNVVALSACQDNQTTLDGTVNGFFTGNLLSTWNRGAFDGSYRQIHTRLASQSTPTITPAINTYGSNRARARLHERPFAF